MAYFFLRAEIAESGGTAGLLATNTIAQGDTREVGLDQLIAHGATVFRAIPAGNGPARLTLRSLHLVS